MVNEPSEFESLKFYCTTEKNKKTKKNTINNFGDMLAFMHSSCMLNVYLHDLHNILKQAFTSQSFEQDFKQPINYVCIDN